MVSSPGEIQSADDVQINCVRVLIFYGGVFVCFEFRSFLCFVCVCVWLCVCEYLCPSFFRYT